MNLKYKQNFLLILFLAAVGFFLLFLQNSSRKESEISLDTIAMPNQKSAVTAVEARKNSQQFIATSAPDTPDEKTSYLEHSFEYSFFGSDLRIALVPSVESVRKEVVSNPHTTPMVLIDFSKTVADEMEKAFQSEKFAGATMKRLRDCALQESVKIVDSARALCLLNARRLSQKYPSFNAELHYIEVRTDARVRNLVDALNQ